MLSPSVYYLQVIQCLLNIYSWDVIVLFERFLLFVDCHKHLISFILILFAFVYGVLTPQHLYPNSTDLYANLYVALILGFGIGFAICLLRPTFVTQQVFYWLLALLVFLFQPVLHHLAYLDALIFPVASLLLCTVLAWVLSDLNKQHRKILADILAYSLLVAGCLTVLTQLMQLLDWDKYLHPYVFPRGGNRLVGNIAQVNQAVFVASMALATLPYFYYTRPGKIRNVFYLAIAFWLCLSFGFAASRGGLILGLAAVGSSVVFYAQAWKKRLTVMMVMLVLAVGGYALGTYWLNLWVAPEMSAVGRFVAGNQNMRLSQLAQAWHAFSNNPFTGVGYGMIKGYGIDHAEEIPWFTVAHHVHNIVGQIAAELGLFGLAIFAFFLSIVLRNLQWRGMQPEKGLAYAVLLLIGLYSLSEYPLWFLRFLMLVPICLALIDDKAKPIRWQPHISAVVLSLAVAFGAWFYIDRYHWYSAIYYYVSQEHLTNEERVKAFQDLPVVFGYHSYRDMMLYAIAEYDTAHLDAHIALGEQSLKVHFSQGMLVKQANLYVLAGNMQGAGKYYRAACVMDFSRECDKVIADLQANARENPAVFGKALADFSAWYAIRFKKPMPVFETH